MQVRCEADKRTVSYMFTGAVHDVRIYRVPNVNHTVMGILRVVLLSRGAVSDHKTNRKRATQAPKGQ